MQVLLLEAYEQLEQDVAKEIDKALMKEREDRATLQRKADFLQVRGQQMGGWRGEGGEGEDSGSMGGGVARRVNKALLLPCRVGFRGASRGGTRVTEGRL